VAVRGPSALVCAALVAACASDPAEEICPEGVATGDVVVTELRGEQSGGDSWGQWIELQNRTGAEVDLHGVVVELTSIDGGTRLRMLVRRSLPVAPGAYVVLGTPPDGELPDHMDYGFGADYETEADGTEFPGAGGVTVTSCGVELDRVVFDDLPTMGTWSLDDGGTWCADTTPGTGSELGLPGTPGEANTPCP
jgi:hypothetical protein